MRWLLLGVLALACSAHATPVEKKYPAARYRTEKLTRYTIEGLTLWQVTGESMPDRNGDRFVVGVDPAGKLIEGWELLRRAQPGLSPAELTGRVFDMLLHGHGDPIDPARDRPLTMFPPEEWALARAPEIASGHLTFWYVEGEMAPRVVRGRLDLATGALDRRSARDILFPPEAALPGIRARLRSSDPATVRAGLEQVDQWKELAPDVEEVLRFPDAQLRMMAIGVLGNLRQPRSVAPLVRLLEEGPAWGDRSLAGQALVMRFGSPEAIAAVRAHVARGGPGQEIAVLRDLLKDWDAGKRH